MRVYQNQAGTWTQIGQDIDGEGPSDNSGQSVSLSADGIIVAIGAPGNDGNGDLSGHVRVFAFAEPEPIPALGEWAVMILALQVIIVGLVGVRGLQQAEVVT